VSQLLLLTNSRQASAEVLPALALLGHHVRVLNAEPSALLEAPPVDILFVDGRKDLVAVRGLCRVIRSTGVTVPVLLITTEGGLAGVNSEWGVDDFVLDSAGPAEVEARLRMALHKVSAAHTDEPDDEIRMGELVVDENAYSARLRNRPLDLTYKEFELLKYLAQHPGRVFTRAQLLQEVWGYDYYGGTRTVDVHVRRLRAKMGPEYEHLIGTVRNVGYRFISPHEQDVWVEQ
jgi:DNA-binding response OmpR family regulator